MSPDEVALVGRLVLHDDVYTEAEDLIALQVACLQRLPKRHSGSLYQASISGSDFLTEPFAAIQDTDGFIGAPAALGSSEMDGGHVVAARKNSPSNRYSTTNLPTFF